MPVDAGIAIVGAGVAIYGAVKKNQAANQAKANLAKRPTYQAQTDNSELNLAQAQAQQGMSAGAQQQLQNNADRSISGLSNAALMGGADANSVAYLADKSQNAYNNNALYGDQVRQQHLGALLNTYGSYAALNQANADKAFQFNKYAPWADQQQLYSQQIAGGQQTMLSGINMGVKGLAGAASASRNDDVKPSARTFGSGSTQGQYMDALGDTPSTMGGYNPGEYTTASPRLGEGTFNVTRGGSGGGGYDWNGMSPYFTAN
jgi:hypothetical protein